MFLRNFNNLRISWNIWGFRKKSWNSQKTRQLWNFGVFGYSFWSMAIFLSISRFLTKSLDFFLGNSMNLGISWKIWGFGKKIEMHRRHVSCENLVFLVTVFESWWFFCLIQDFLRNPYIFAKSQEFWDSVKIWGLRVQFLTCAENTSGVKFWYFCWWF